MSRSTDWNQKETEKILFTINEFELISERTVLYSYICDVASFYAQTVQQIGVFSCSASLLDSLATI